MLEMAPHYTGPELTPDAGKPHRLRHHNVHHPRHAR
jgi:hypothetical protein